MWVWGGDLTTRCWVGMWDNAVLSPQVPIQPRSSQWWSAVRWGHPGSA